MSTTTTHSHPTASKKLHILNTPLGSSSVRPSCWQAWQSASVQIHWICPLHPSDAQATYCICWEEMLGHYKRALTFLFSLALLFFIKLAMGTPSFSCFLASDPDFRHQYSRPEAFAFPLLYPPHFIAAAGSGQVPFPTGHTAHLSLSAFSAFLLCSKHSSFQFLL